VEVGGATPRPQEGNPKPRVFRIPSQNAMINRYGLNSEGADDLASRLRHRVREFAYSLGYGLDEAAERRVLDGEAGVPPGSLYDGRLMAVQIAKNKTTPDGDIDAVTADYVYCVDRLGKYADIIVVNVSSPNTPGLRGLQRVEPLTKILNGVVGAAKSVDRKKKPAVMVKVSPDEDSEEQIKGICDAVWQSGVDGVIVGNTTNRRPATIPAGYTLPEKETATLREIGGYSGPQLFEGTLALVKRYRKSLDEGFQQRFLDYQESSKSSGSGEEKQAAGAATGDNPEDQILEKVISGGKSIISSVIPTKDKPESNWNGEPKVIFATGGIANGQQALAILNAGASVAMVYTALVYGGVGTITRIKSEMREETYKGKSA
jgi:dihydroorotate dehydrogenase